MNQCYVLISDVLIVPLTIIINKCLEEGVFPEELKTARVVPVYKKGDKLSPENYRPISILPSLSKIFEQVIKIRLVEFFEENALLSNHQHGYRRGKSTTTALLEIVDQIITSEDEGIVSEIVSRDLSKAFDCIDHDLLLEKLKHYGVKENAFLILESYLRDRVQQVEWSGLLSRRRLTGCGVPQGSVLGPVLFIIFMNDMNIKYSSSLGSVLTSLFADDTSFFMKASCSEALVSLEGAVLDESDEWFQKNFLKVNQEKTQKILFGGGEISSLKFLGLHLDSRLTWEVHLEELKKKLNTALYTIRVIDRVCTRGAAMAVYYANFHSLTSYGILLWGTSSHASEIFILQKKAIRVLYHLKATDSCRDAYRELSILTVPAVFILECVNHVHKNASLFPMNSTYHPFNTRNRYKLAIPYHKKKRTQQSVDFWGPKLYNHLPEEVKKLNKISFKKKIKELLLSKTIYSIEEFLTDT